MLHFDDQPFFFLSAQRYLSLDYQRFDHISDLHRELSVTKKIQFAEIDAIDEATVNTALQLLKGERGLNACMVIPDVCSFSVYHPVFS